MTDRATRWLGRGRVFVGSVVLAAVTQIVLGLDSVGSLDGSLARGASSAAFAAYNVVSTSVRQQLVPSSLLGRVTGAYRTCTMSAAAIGAAGGGSLAAALDITAPFLVGGGRCSRSCAFAPVFSRSLIHRRRPSDAIAFVDLDRARRGSLIGATPAYCPETARRVDITIGLYLRVRVRPR